VYFFLILEQTGERLCREFDLEFGLEFGLEPCLDLDLDLGFDLGLELELALALGHETRRAAQLLPLA
jgi:hypothetical protein